MTTLNPHFVTDHNGTRLSVLLPIDEYERLITQIEDLEDQREAREILARIECGEEDMIPWEQIKAEHAL